MTMPTLKRSFWKSSLMAMVIVAVLAMVAMAFVPTPAGLVVDLDGTPLHGPMSVLLTLLGGGVALIVGLIVVGLAIVLVFVGVPLLLLTVVLLALLALAVGLVVMVLTYAFPLVVPILIVWAVVAACRRRSPSKSDGSFPHAPS